MSLSQFSFEFATLYKLGESHLGKFLASLLAFPLLFLFRMIYYWNTTIFYWICLILGALIFVVVNFALKYTTDLDSSVIVWDKIIGLMVAFISIPLRIKLILFGYLLFYIILISKHSLFGTYLSEKLDKLPGVFGIFATDIVIGFIVNFFLRFMIWVVF